MAHDPRPHRVTSFTLCLVVLALSGPGCGFTSLIFGGDQHVDNKSHDYSVLRLDREDSPAWHYLNMRQPEPADQIDKNPSSEETGDVAFEHAKSGAIISVNSVCREYRMESLEELTEDLFLGIQKRGPLISKNTEVDGAQALESTVHAAQKSDPTSEVRIRAVVLRKSGCTFDIMYIAKPAVFENLLPDFERFLKGFRVH